MSWFLTPVLALLIFTTGLFFAMNNRFDLATFQVAISVFALSFDAALTRTRSGGGKEGR